MRRLLLVLVALWAAPAMAQNFCSDWDEVSPGEWCQVPSSRLDSAARCQDPGWDCSTPGNPKFSCSGYGFATLTNLMIPWSGGTYDTARHKFIVHGGGHGNYCGNEIYEFDTDTLIWTQVTPTEQVPGGFSDTNPYTPTTYPSGRPGSTHTYQHLVVLESTGEMCSMSRCGNWSVGNCGLGGIYCNNPSGRNLVSQGGLQGWSNRTPSNYVSSEPCAFLGTDYNPNDGNVYVDQGTCGNGANRLARWNPSTNTYTVFSSQSGDITADYAVRTIDPVNNVMMGLGKDSVRPLRFWAWYLTDPDGGGPLTVGSRISWAGGQLAQPPSACDRSGPGWTFDSANAQFVAWCGGDDTYTYNFAHNFDPEPASGTVPWTTCLGTQGAPSSPQTFGTYGRFQYVPAHDGFVLVNTTQENVWLYRLPSSCGGSPPVAQCADGIDNDGDGVTDLADAGCADSSDTSEQNPNIDCDNGIDDDTDGAVDLADGGCPNILDADETNCGDGVCEGGEFANVVAAEQGLDFPLVSPDATVNPALTMRFKFTNPHTTGLPIYGTGGAGVTYIWRAYPRIQNGYWTAFFWGNDDGAGALCPTFGWDGPPCPNGVANTYYGAHPYPQPPPTGSASKWEISVNSNDYLSPNNVEYNRWHIQAFRAWSDGSGKHHQFYYDLPNLSAVISQDAPTTYGNTNPPAPALTWGDAPWQPGNERWSGILRGFQIYSSLLSVADIQAEIASPLSTAAGVASIWYLNLNPTPTDIADDSGQGHNPAWVGSNRPNPYDTSAPGSCDADCLADPNVLNVGTCAWDYPTPYSLGYKCTLAKTNGVDSDYDLDSAIAVRYRKTTVPTWTVAHPGQLVLRDDSIVNPNVGGQWIGQYYSSGSAIGEPGVHLRGDTHYAGAIWDLEPNTAYFVEFTFTDPDGGGELQTLQTSTRAEPVANPASPNYPCPDGNASDTVDNGAADNCTTAAQINTSVTAATAGSIVRIAAGTYTPAAGQNQVVNLSGKSGTESNPIFIRCVDQATTILANGTNTHVVYSSGNTNFVYLEDCTIRSNSPFTAVNITGNGERFVFRRNLVQTLTTGSQGTPAYSARGSGAKYGFHYEDNRVEGAFTNLAARGTSSDEGNSAMWGQGHVWLHNTFSGTGDALGGSYADQNSGVTIQTRHWYVEGNDVRSSKDDCFEFDYTFGNMVILRNRCQNAQDCFSTQAGFGGPFYFLRNVCWISGRRDALKIKTGTSYLGDPDDFFDYNNLLNLPWENFMGGGRTFEFHLRNNLWVGFVGNDGTVSDTGETHYGRYKRTGALPCGEVTNNGYNLDEEIDWDQCGGQEKLAVHLANGIVEQNSRILTEPIFADRSGWTPANTYPDDDGDASLFFDITDPRLHASSNAIDAGAVIPNVTDGFAGAAPDLGPYEIGMALEPYGVRTGTPPPDPACDDGADNDGDGLTDFPADGGCASALDTSERGAPEQCDDGSDNDGDGLFDYPADPQCTGPTDNDETAGVVFQCSDTIDNDSDGTIDCSDPACAPGGTCNGTLDTEVGSTQCDDDIDNDFDGAIDCADGACLSGAVCQPGRTTEVNCGDARCSFGAGETISGCPGDCRECNDGLDNDGDGLTDHPNDAGCTTPTDSDESNCGDGVCEGGEDPTSCAADCVAPPTSPASLRGAELRGGSR